MSDWRREYETWFGTKPFGSLIGGAIVPGQGPAIELVDPARETVAFAYNDGGAAVSSAAMAAAREGLVLWQKLGASARGRILWSIGAKLRARAESLATIEAAIAGKPIRDARVEVAKVAEMFEYYAGWADKIAGDVIPVPGSHLNYVRREPIGIVAQITPWNAPIFTAGWQIAPALAAGNAVILKPSELTPITSVCLGLLAIEAGVPAGALSVLAGNGATTGAALAGDPAIGKIVFVGSPATGRAIAVAAARNARPCLLELGGKSANIVFPDADLARASKGAQAAIFAGAGQSCTAGSRLIVHKSIHDRFVATLAAAARRLRVGMPLDPATEIGPIASRPQFERIGAMVAAGQAAGAQAVCGGGRAEGRESGFFYAPTILTQLDPAMPIVRDEIFGPVLSVLTFEDEAEAVALANAGPFDLAGAVWTKDVGRAHRVAAGVRAGSFWINGYRTLSVMTPFGGMQGSGYGRSSGYDAMLEYTQSKSVWVETDDHAPQPFGYAPE
jgi:aldehyde dehydrogenase (NAD+)